MTKTIVDMELLLEMKNYIEQRETQLDCEFGDCRSVEKMIADNDMPDIYKKICELIDDENEVVI